MEDIRARIEQEVGSWEGVTAHPISEGRIEFRLGRKMFGQVNREGWSFLPFTTRIREMLVGTGRARSSGLTGWVKHEPDVEAIELFRLGYERARVAALRQQRGEAVGSDIAAADDHADPPA